MMNLANVIERLQEKGTRAELVTTIKNGTELTGIRIITDSTVSPVVYPNEGEFVDDFVEKVIRIANQPQPNFNISKLQDRNYVLANVVVVMEKKSQESIIKRDFLDLQGVVRIVISDGNGVIGSAKVTETMAKGLELTEDDLFAAALANMRTRFCIKSMSELLGLPQELEDELSMNIVTTNTATAASAALMVPDVFSEFCVKHGVSQCTILPSSAEELIVLPGKQDAEHLVCMVNEINNEVVDATIQLNPTVYLYDADTGKVSIAAKF